METLGDIFGIRFLVMSLLFLWFPTPNLWEDLFSFPGGFSHETAALTRRCVLFQSRLCPFRSGGNPAVGTPRLLWPPAHGSLPVPRLWQDLYVDERDLFLSAAYGTEEDPQCVGDRNGTRGHSGDGPSHRYRQRHHPTVGGSGGKTRRGGLGVYDRGMSSERSPTG